MRIVSPILATDVKDLTVIGLFDFLEWNEAHIVATIHRRLEWTKPYNVGQLQSCIGSKSFLYKEMLGFTKNDEFLSGMVREKMITIEKALTKLREANKLQENFLAEVVAEA
jgi:hypothetical protein